MIFLGERLVQQAIQAGLSTFCGNLAQFVPDVFGQLDSNEQGRISNWFSNPANKLTVQIGYLLENQALPAVAITLAAEDEPRDRQIIGSMARFQLGSPTTTPVTPTQYQFTRYIRSVYRCDCVSDNQNFVLWLQALVKWCLYTQAANLEMQDADSPTALLNQKISATDLEPYKIAIRDEAVPVYTRAVTLTADHFDTWNTVPNLSLITSVGATLTGTPFTE